ncbi:Cof-type HAD-IIB family hydrolase [Bacillus horti]|uniref:Cof subfamily protein (Haloacid dehalogenase superfamily) n=1 Tax=Caldalkalibacillus horti TaxID=77523 RepID=A0ABT9VTL2_9BACI|nr:Cof-type HAD-IIB family hydrolase [Bacillus horti]MDQ0164192.1 Cof subfamily protein (haloacid dehalogenase superfamily) [Bacillus horti]
MTKKPYLIAVDLDGTLLTDNKTISTRTKQSLHQAVKQGHKVVISTGRPFRSSEMYYKELGLDTPIVNFNGALVHHPLHPEWGVFHSPLEANIAKQIIQTAGEFGVQNIMVEVMDDVYLKEHDEVLLQSFFDPTIEITLLSDSFHKDPTSVLIHPYEHNVDKLREFLDQHHAEVVEHRKWGAPWNVIEIIRKGLSKAVGLERVCHSFDIPAERVIAFGDEDNDFEMIQFAGVGVAMGNAIADLKERANEITLTNEEDGIAHFLEKNLL